MKRITESLLSAFALVALTVSTTVGQDGAKATIEQPLLKAATQESSGSLTEDTAPSTDPGGPKSVLKISEVVHEKQTNGVKPASFESPGKSQQPTSLKLPVTSDTDTWYAVGSSQARQLAPIIRQAPYSQQCQQPQAYRPARVGWRVRRFFRR